MGLTSVSIYALVKVMVMDFATRETDASPGHILVAPESTIIQACLTRRDECQMAHMLSLTIYAVFSPLLIVRDS